MRMRLIASAWDNPILLFNKIMAPVDWNSKSENQVVEFVKFLNQTGADWHVEWETEKKRKATNVYFVIHDEDVAVHLKLKFSNFHYEE